MNLKEILTLDKYHLDKHLVEIPNAIRYFSEQGITAAKARDKAKIKLELIEAQETNKLLANFKEMGYDKSPTVAQQTAYIKTCAEYQKQQDVLIEKQGELGYCNAAVSSLEAAKSSVSNLVKLNQMGYWADINMDEYEQKQSGHGRLRSRSK